MSARQPTSFDEQAESTNAPTSQRAPSTPPLMGGRQRGNRTAYPEPVSIKELAAGTFPRPEFLLQRLVLQGHVNLLYGDGGTGKTLLALHFAVAVAAGRNLFGLKASQQPVLLILAEDDYGETKARLQAICDMLELSMDALPITIWCLPGHDLRIAQIKDDGNCKEGPFLAALRARLTLLGPCFVVLDTVSDIVSLDENKRLAVNTFCKVVLGGLCRTLSVTLLVNAHPSKAGMGDGSGYAGSTAWNNAVRHRLTIEKLPGKSRCVLKVAKSNYAGESSLELRLADLTFLTSAEAGQSEAQIRQMVLEVTLEMIDRGLNVVRGNGSGQKPRDLAKELLDRHGVELAPGNVLLHLNALERQGRLAYEPGGNQKRGQRAGYRRPRE